MLSNEGGPVIVPPRVPDPVGNVIKGVALSAAAGIGVYIVTRRRTKSTLDRSARRPPRREVVDIHRAEETVFPR